MSAYVVVDVHVKDPGAYEEYRRLVPPTIAAYDGRYLSRGGRTEVLEGEWTPERFVILEFPSLERAKEWLHSPEYGAIKHIRHRYATTSMVVTEGL